MKLSIFADTKFLTDGKGNFYTSSNIRRAMLYPIADRFEKLYLVCRVLAGDFGHVPAEDMVNHPKIKFVPVPYFKGIFGSLLRRSEILPKIHYAIERSDVCVLRFGSNISCLALPVIERIHKPSIGHVIGDFGMEIEKNPKHIPIPGLRQLVAGWMVRRNTKAFQACDLLCGVTETIAKRYAQPDRKVFQLIDSCLSEECYSSPKQNDNESIKAIFAGRLVKFKNVQNFLHAVAKVSQDTVEINAVVVGEGDFKSRLVELARQLNIEKNVEFTGRIESRRKLWQKYRTADVGFLLSFSEGLPLGAIEPMSVGLPLLAARLDYMETIVTDGVEGFLVDPGNVDEISEKLKVLATQPDLRNKMALAAYEKSKLFSAENQATKLFQMADELCKKA